MAAADAARFNQGRSRLELLNFASGRGDRFPVGRAGEDVQSLVSHPLGMHLHSVIIAFKPAPIKTFDAFLRFPVAGQIGNPG